MNYLSGLLKLAADPAVMNAIKALRGVSSDLAKVSEMRLLELPIFWA